MRQPLAAASLNPTGGNQNFAGYKRDSLLAVKELGGHQVGGGDVGTIVANAGKAFRSRSPVVDDEADILGDAQAEILAHPVGHLELKANKDVRPMLTRPGAEFPSMGGSWLAPRDLIAAGNWREITRRASETIQIIQASRALV